MNALALALLVSAAATGTSSLRPVSTYSIVARDPQTGQIGVAVQSHWFAVGQIVPWAEAGTGAVATQSFVDPAYGKLGLELMRAGRSAPDTLRALLAGDGSRDVRQVAMVDARGIVAAWTGRKDIRAAGHEVGPCPAARPFAAAEGSPSCAAEPGQPDGSKVDVGGEFSVQANLMVSDRVWPAMAAAYRRAREGGADLAERMLAALDAAQAAGGDIRGRQSAALVVVSAASTGRPWQDRIFDLRVDDAPDPLVELRRLVALQRAYNHMNAGDLAVEHKDQAAALREYAAAERLAEKTEGVPPSRLAEMRFWHAIALVNMKRVEQALPVFRAVFAGPDGAAWRELVGRLPQSELVPDDPRLLSRIQSIE